MIGLIQNLITGNISMHFHMASDECFQTVGSTWNPPEDDVQCYLEDHNEERMDQYQQSIHLGPHKE